MSKTGTRRTTIMNRRAGQQARFAYWGKRIGGLVLVCAVITGAGHYAVQSGYYDQVYGRMARSFHAQMVDSGFGISNILVEGRKNSNLRGLKYAINMEKGQSIFEPHLDEVKAEIEKIVWIKQAVVERHLPDTVTIRLTERTPMALWQNKGKLSVIDTDGGVLTDATNLSRFKNLMLLVGDDAPKHAADLLSMIVAEPDLHDRVESAKWIGGRRWDLFLKNGVSVKLPEDDLGQAVRRLATAHGEAGLMDRKIRSIDLRDPLRIVVQTQPGAVEEYQASYKPQKNI